MTSGFADYVVGDLLTGVEGVKARAMFGGHGVYKDGLIFAIIVEDELYYKVGEANRKEFEARGSEPFVYRAKGNKRVAMSYWKLPSEVMDDRELLLEWTEKAVNVSRSAGVNKIQRRPMKNKVKRGSSKFREEHASKKQQTKSFHMTGQVSGFPRGNKSAKKRGN